MKLYFFDLYGRTEQIRMALYLSKIEYEDVRLTPEEMKAMKADLEFGQVPMLELDDGTKLVQSEAILNYVLSLSDVLQPSDPMERYNGSCTAAVLTEDFAGKHKNALKSYYIPSSEAKHASMVQVIDANWPNTANHLARRLPADKPFIGGEKLNIYDIKLAGYLVHMLRYHKCPVPEVQAKMWEQCPERLQKYVTDFQENMKEYLEKRPDCAY